MIRFLFALIFVSTFASAAQAATASCSGKFRNLNLFFKAQGSIAHKNDGTGFVKINNRVVAQFDGDAANINYLTQSFRIRNNRGDVVEGKLHNLSGAATLTRLELPGEGIRIYNTPVRCSVN